MTCRLASIYQVAGRTLLRPDVEGQYTVIATIVTTAAASTNMTQTITAGTYVGVNTCAFCHSGGIQAPDMYHPGPPPPTRSSSPTASMAHHQMGSYSASCLKCHTVGYDTTATAINGGFDDVATPDRLDLPRPC